LVSAEAKADFLGALAQKGETVEEIGAFARLLREKAVPVPVEASLQANLLDVVGTGGDRLGTFNVSTCSALVAAAAGVAVAKHGNRAVTSKVGSADVIETLGLPLDRASVGAAAIELSPWRGEEISLPGGGLVINDAYNANPDSMRAALEHLVERAGDRRCVAVLGEMAELGSESDRYHHEIGEIAARLGVELIGVGEPARGYEPAAWVPGVEEAIDAARALVRPGDVVLVKASRAVGLEGIAAEIANFARAWFPS
jgi:UDP-N-acetylmuramoyl-tripeptide--D-alanyl-D-alanine ligase